MEEKKIGDKTNKSRKKDSYVYATCHFMFSINAFWNSIQHDFHTNSAARDGHNDSLTFLWFRNECI